MPSPWTETAARYLRNNTMCPRCNATLVEGDHCSACYADLSGPEAVELQQASVEAAEALERRQVLIDALPTAPIRLTVAAAAVEPAVQAAAPVTIPNSAPATTATSHLSVQSVLAVAGAGLFAVAAIVFTFFNPDLTNFTTRTAIIAGITLLFIGAAWQLSRRGLQFSAEAIGALGAVFVVLDVWAFSNTAPGSATGWLFLAIGTIVASAGLLALAVRVRVRTWLWTALVGIILVPSFLALSADLGWLTALGWVASGFAAIGAHRIARRLGGRFDSPMRADRVTATIAQFITLVLTAGQLLLLAVDSADGWALPASGVIALVALMAALSAHTLLPRLWSYLAGALFVLAVAIIPSSLVTDDSWQISLRSIAAAVALVAVAAVAPRFGIRLAQLRAGALTVALAAVLPAVWLAAQQFVMTLIQLVTGVTVQDLTVGADASVAPSYGLAAIVALAATAGGVAAVSSYRTISLWIGMAALSTFVGWSALLRPTQSLLAVALAVGICLLLARVPRFAAMRTTRRLPLLFGAHLLVLQAAVISWTDPDIRVLVGVAVVASILALALAMPVVTRPLYVGIAYAYALAIIAAALALAGLEVIAVLCLTSSIGSIAALLATLTRWLKVRAWYAVLIVTAVPFVLGVVSVLQDRSGWTALSTAVTFALLLALVLTRREGMTRYLRTAAASLLVPALAVVIICLGAQVLSVSASPITLPIIAVIVAGALPTAGIVSAWLMRHGIAERDAGSVRVAVEIGALVTGAVAVLLALVRAAAGIPTTFLVLLILGVGAIATAVFAKRRWGWPLAGASWTGALWCIWALNGITAVEPYLLPPALGLALAGAFLTARGLPGMGLSAVGLVWTGLGAAALPTLAILAAIGSGDGATAPWRTIGILASALALIVLGALVPRLVGVPALARIGVLRTPLLVTAVVAASAGAIQAIRYGWDLDKVVDVSGPAVMAPVLVSSLVAVALATIAARLLAADAASPAASTARIARSRALYVPAVIYLVVGPIAGIREGWFPIIALLVITVALLALIIVTTVRACNREVTLPPVLFLFAVAWCTAVASWSERELRVEAYSLPLGVALLAVGIIAMVPGAREIDRATLRTWPIGFAGSWRLLGPGILAIFVPSVLATGTDPLTQRAIMVIALALVAILIGNMRRLAAPFILGIIVLPIENVVVFAVQIGRNIGALPWWITLATAGAVLLVIAVSSERRVGGDKGAAARVRDLT